MCLKTFTKMYACPRNQTWFPDSFSCMSPPHHNTHIYRVFTHKGMEVMRCIKTGPWLHLGGGGRGAKGGICSTFPKTWPLLGTCNHCVRCGNKTSDASPKLFNCQLLTIFLNEPLLKLGLILVMGTCVRAALTCAGHTVAARWLL